MENESSRNGTGQPLDEHRLQELFTVVYQELRRMARAMKWFDGSPTTPTAIVHEAYIKLAAADTIRVESELHFKHLVVLAMRRILWDAARRRRADKNGGKDFLLVSLDETREPVSLQDHEVSVLFDGLDDLARTAPRLAAIVEHKVIGGWSHAEIASFLGLSETTVKREWRAARAWLMRYLRQPGLDRQEGSHEL